MNVWLKKAVVVTILLGFLTVILPIAWQMLRPALPILFLAACALYALVRILRKSGGGW